MNDGQAGSEDDAEALVEYLGRYAARRALAQSLRQVAPIWAGALVAGLGLMLMDARFGLGAPARAMVEFGAAAVIGWGLWRLARVWSPRGPERRRRGLAAAARHAERRLGIDDSRIINAVQLGGEPGGDFFIRRVRRRGLGAIAGVRSSSMVEWRRSARGVAALASIVAAIAMVFLVSPRFPAQVLPRFVAPFADYPPFTWTDFAFSVEPDEVTLGEDATIRLVLGGLLPGAISLRTETGAELPLARTDGGTDSGRREYRAALSALTDPVRLRAVGDTGESRAVTIAPIPRPRFLAATLSSEGRTLALRANDDEANFFAAAPGAIVVVRIECSAPVEHLEIAGPFAGDKSAARGSAWITMRVPDEGKIAIAIRPVGVGELASRDSVFVSIEASAALTESPSGDAAEGDRGLRPLSKLTQAGRAATAASNEAVPAADASDGSSATTRAAEKVASAESPAAIAAGAHPESAGGITQGEGGAGAGRKDRGGAPAAASSEVGSGEKPDKALRSREPEPATADRPGVGATHQPDASNFGADPASIAALPEAYRSMAVRYYRILTRRSRGEGTP